MTKIKIFLTCIGFSIFTSFSLFAQTPLEDAQAYLKANSLKFGLNGDDISDIEVSASHVSSASGIKHIYYTQKFKGVSVYGTYSSQHYNSKGEFIHINNAFIPNLPYFKSIVLLVIRFKVLNRNLKTLLNFLLLGINFISYV